MLDPMQWAHYPMGPSLRGYLKIDDRAYLGESSPRPSEQEAERFSEALIDYFTAQPIVSTDQWIDIVEELTAMSLSQVAIFLAEEDFRDDAKGDFRSALAIGCSYMLEERFDDALSFLIEAQKAEPEEPASYVNIASVYYAQKQDQRAKEWLLAGLDVDANHKRLWELLASILLHADKASAGDMLRQIGTEKQSYLGLSLAADFLEPQDPMFKAELLDDLYASLAEPDAEFLIEYTAALGMAQRFEQIPTVVWKAKNIAGTSLPWKLYAHVVQAHLAMENLDEASASLATLKRCEDVSEETLKALAQAIEEEREYLSDAPKS